MTFFDRCTMRDTVLRACRILPSKRFVGLKAMSCSTTVRSEWMNIQNGPSPARETMPGLVLTNSVQKDASAGAARGLSAAAGAGVSVIQPTPGLFVGPTGDGKARRPRPPLPAPHIHILLLSKVHPRR